MPVTRFNDAVLALLGAYQAAAPFSAPGGGGVPVYDGLQPTTASDPDFLIVGHDGTLEADGTLAPDALAGTYLQQWIHEGTQQETGSVSCLIVCQSGDSGDAAGRRQRAAVLLGAAEDAAAAAGGYPAAAPGLTFDGTTDGRWISRQALGGIAVMVAYRVSYSTAWA